MTAVEKSASVLDSAVKAVMQKNKEERLSEIQEEIDNLSVDIHLTKNLQQVIMNNFEELNPDFNHLKKIYFDTQTMGYVLLDRLIYLEDKANELVSKIYNQ